MPLPLFLCSLCRLLCKGGGGAGQESGAKAGVEIEKLTGVHDAAH